MYSLPNLYKQLLNLHVQIDAAAKPKVVLLDLLNLNRKIGLKVAFGITFSAKYKQSSASCILKGY